MTESVFLLRKNLPVWFQPALRSAQWVIVHINYMSAFCEWIGKSDTAQTVGERGKPTSQRPGRFKMYG